MLVKDEVEGLAEEYLIMNVGNLVVPGEAKFDEEKKIWILSVFHSSHVAYFEMGKMTIDENGNVLTLNLLEDSPEIRDLEKYGYKENKEKPENLRKLL